MLFRLFLLILMVNGAVITEEYDFLVVTIP